MNPLIILRMVIPSNPITIVTLNHIGMSQIGATGMTMQNVAPGTSMAGTKNGVTGITTVAGNIPAHIKRRIS